MDAEKDRELRVDEAEALWTEDREAVLDCVKERLGRSDVVWDLVPVPAGLSDGDLLRLAVTVDDRLWRRLAVAVHEAVAVGEGVAERVPWQEAEAVKDSTGEAVGVRVGGDMVHDEAVGLGVRVFGVGLKLGDGVEVSVRDRVADPTVAENEVCVGVRVDDADFENVWVGEGEGVPVALGVQVLD